MITGKVWTEEENRISGIFGESATAFFLSKRGVNVLLVDTVFFDVIAREKSAKIFNTTKKVGISVKFRDRRYTTSSCTVAIKDFPKIKEMSEKWDVIPWFCYLIAFKNKQEEVLEGFLFSAEDAIKYMATEKQKYAISFAKLRQARKDNQISKECYFRWQLEKAE